VIDGEVVHDKGETVCGVWLPGGVRQEHSAIFGQLVTNILTCRLQFLLFKHIYTMNRDPKHFRASTSFLPERWLPHEMSNPTLLFYHDKRQGFQSFSVGPRSCMGVHLAKAEMRLILAKLMFNFEFKAPENGVLLWEQLRTFLLVEKKPIRVRMPLRRDL
jgi:cytochrome P450